MELHDRILNIKKLLKYCSNQEIEIYEKKSGKFFHDLFAQDKFYHHMYFDAGFTIGLYLDTVAEVPTMFIEYIYEYDREGSDATLVLFNDDDAKYRYVTEGGFGAYGDRNSPEGHGILEYSDIPDWIWEIIENTLKEKANKNRISKLTGQFKYCYELNIKLKAICEKYIKENNLHPNGKFESFNFSPNNQVGLVFLEDDNIYMNMVNIEDLLDYTE